MNYKIRETLKLNQLKMSDSDLIKKLGDIYKWKKFKKYKLNNIYFIF